ncbi:MAG: DUF4845 domain-containing protein [Polycyclovorans sp.]|nr:DUF4845 domain-containing protein [Gammaproteobacteria bacterium]MDP1543006.1 DUF4845 domain-containing protein [Polycyclovorans sp.]
MINRQGQRGLGGFGLLILFAGLGFVMLIAFKCIPVYLNQMKISRAVSAVAMDAPGSVVEIRSALQRYWDIEDIDDLSPRDVKVVRSASGRRLSYDYEARRHLFANVSLVLEFGDDVPLAGPMP